MTGPTTKSKTVPLNPSSFVEPSIIELTAGDVIRMYHTQEAKRKRVTDVYGESDVAVPFRSAPEGLLEALDEIADVSGMRRSVITKCLSHHIMAWYQYLPQVSLLSRLYKSVQVQSDGFPDIMRKVKRDDYEFVHPRAINPSVGLLRTVAYVIGYLGDISGILGIPSYKLFLTGLCWSLSTNTEGWAKDTVSRFLVPERDGVLSYLGERLLTLDYADKLARLRHGDAQTVEYIKSLDDRKWE